MQDITWLLEIGVMVLGALLTKYLIPLIKQKLDEKQLSELDYWLKLAVYAAEERYRQFPGQGAQKYQEVKQFLAEKGYGFADEEFQVLIDGMVQQVVHAWQEEPADETKGG